MNPEINNPIRLRDELADLLGDYLGLYHYPDGSSAIAIMVIEPGDNPGLPTDVTATGLECVAIFGESMDSTMTQNGMVMSFTHRIILRSWDVNTHLFDPLVILKRRYGFRFTPGVRVPSSITIGNLETSTSTLVESIRIHNGQH